MSRNHAFLAAKGDDYLINDNNSSNHVYVNGEKVSQKLLESGDRINLSRNVTLLYFSESDADEKINQMLNRMWDVVNKNDFLHLKEVTGKVISLDSLDKILNVILTEVIELVGAERGFIALVDKEGNFLPDTSVSHNINLENTDNQKAVFSHSIIQKVIEEKEKVFVLNAVDSEELVSNSILELDLRSIMCSPLIFGDKLLGILYVDAVYQLSDFSEMDQFFFTILSDHVAIAIENAALFDKVKRWNLQLKEEITESEERYRQLVELFPDSIMVYSEDKIVFVNAKTTELFGACDINDLASQLKTKECSNFIPDILHAYEKAQEEEKKICIIEQKFIRNDGVCFELEISASPLVYQGKPSIIIIARDITTKKKMDEELSRIQKLESLGILAGGIAHDFNNILTAIIGNISLARNDIDSCDEINTFLLEAENASLRAKDLAQQLLTFSRGGSLIKKVTNIKDTVIDAANFAVRGSNTKCFFAIPNDLWLVEADEGQISRVVSNLALNAQQAMPEGGIIGITAENVVVDNDSLIPLAADNYIKISIEDSGIGIPEKNLSKIFDPYFTTKQKGSGLGLPISYSIIKRHGGYISAVSKLGYGSTFYFYLPATSKKQTLVFPCATESIMGRGRILLMDDEEIILKVGGKMLELIGYEPDFAKDGVEAIAKYQMAKENNIPYKAVIMDLTVPGGMGGMAAIKKLQVIDSEIKAVVSSDYSSDPIMANFKDYGFSAFLAKPYKIKELGDKLKSILKEDGNSISQ